MKAPRFATIALSLDTARFRERRPEERDRIMRYLLERLMFGEEVAQDALEHYGVKVTIRPALKPEILP